MPRLPAVVLLLATSTPALAAPCVYTGSAPTYALCIAQQASDAFDMAVANDIRLQDATEMRHSIDGVESIVAVSAPFHMTVTASASAGTSRQIPMDVIDDLCGDPDGCDFRLGMTRWDASEVLSAANGGGRLYYSPTNGAWRSNLNDGNFVSGDGVVDYVLNLGAPGGSAWNTCYFTDGDFVGYVSTGDATRGMSLLLWNGFSGPNRTCELTIFD